MTNYLVLWALVTHAPIEILLLFRTLGQSKQTKKQTAVYYYYCYSYCYCLTGSMLFSLFLVCVVATAKFLARHNCQTE